MDYKISEEVAQQQLDQLIDYYEFDFASIENEAQKEVFCSAQSKVKSAIRRGRIEICRESDLVVKQYLKSDGDNKIVEYRPIMGRDKMAMAKVADGDNYGKMYTLLGGMSGLTFTAISNFKGPDLKVAESLAILFLQL